MPSPTTLLSGENDATVGAGGAEPMTGSKAFEMLLTLPAASVAVAVKLCVPAASDPALIFQLPPASATPVPRRAVPSNSLIVLPASAVPVTITAVPDAGASEIMTGAFGAIVSTVTFSAAEAPLTLPGAANEFAIVTASENDLSLLLPAASMFIAVKL